MLGAVAEAWMDRGQEYWDAIGLGRGRRASVRCAVCVVRVGRSVKAVLSSVLHR